MTCERFCGHRRPELPDQSVRRLIFVFIFNFLKNYYLVLVDPAIVGPGQSPVTHPIEVAVLLAFHGVHDASDTPVKEVGVFLFRVLQCIERVYGLLKLKIFFKVLIKFLKNFNTICPTTPIHMSILVDPYRGATSCNTLSRTRLGDKLRI